jgi:membrane associated rhomboid family serine protease
MTQTLLIIIVTCAISIYGLNERSIIGKLIMDPILVKHGQYYRLLTSGFIHADYFHLAFNMFTLYSFGRFTEDFFNNHGKYVFLIVYLVAIVVSSIPPFIKNRDNTRYLALGASGGVSAILFAAILLSPWTTLTIWFIPCPAIIFGVVYLAYSYYMGKRNADGIGHDAHLSGAIFGILITIIIEPAIIPYFLESLKHPHFLGF